MISNGKKEASEGVLCPELRTVNAPWFPNLKGGQYFKCLCSEDNEKTSISALVAYNVYCQISECEVLV